MKKFIFISLLMVFLASSVSAGIVPCGLSVDDPDQDGDQTVKCTLCHLLVMGKNIVDTLLLRIIPPLAVLFAVISGAYFILGAGYDSSLISKAKAVIWSVVIGLLIIYSSWLVVNLFFSVIGVADWTGLKGNWWQIDCSTSYVPPNYAIENSNQQPTAPNQAAAFLGITQPMANEEIPEPNF